MLAQGGALAGEQRERTLWCEAAGWEQVWGCPAVWPHPQDKTTTQTQNQVQVCELLTQILETTRIPRTSRISLSVQAPAPTLFIVLISDRFISIPMS